VHALLTPPRGLLLALALAVPLFGAPACRQKVTRAQCDELVSRYAELVIRDKMPNAPQDLVKEQQGRVREEARGDEGFRNCTTEVGPREFECAMSAATPEAIEKCLE
jgi:hypothetical protein